MNARLAQSMATAVATMPSDWPADTAALANLAQHAADAQGAYAANTERALRSDVAVFSDWCTGAGLSSLPALAGTVAAFVGAMTATKAPSTVRRYLSSVATFHRAAKLPNPCEAEPVRLALKRLHREKGRAQVQAAPLNRGLVDSMIAKAGAGTKSLRDRALLALAYDTLCRRSELVALHVASLERGSAGDGTILIPRGKTDQEGRGMVRYVAPDTMRHIEAWLDKAQIEDGPLFRSVSEAGRVGGPLDPGDVSRIFKALATKAGVSAERVARISGHSSRVGAAQDMMSGQMELPAVMQAGGWKSAEMVSRYTRNIEARRSAAAKLAVAQNRA